MENKYFITTDGELYHHGVPGMRWGVRRNRPDTDAEKEYRRVEMKKKITNGAKAAGKTLGIVGGVLIADEVLMRGAGRKVAVGSLKVVGKLTMQAIARHT